MVEAAEEVADVGVQHVLVALSLEFQHPSHGHVVGVVDSLPGFHTVMGPLLRDAASAITESGAPMSRSVCTANTYVD